MQTTIQKIKNSTYVLIIFFISLTLSFCDNGNDNKNELSESKIVTENIQDVISFEEIMSFEPGTKMKLWINRKDTTVKEYIVSFESAYSLNGENLIIAKTEKDLPIGAGDSGSPLLTMDNRIAGSLCYGYYYNNHQFIARSIEDVISLKDFVPTIQEKRTSGIKKNKRLPLAKSIHGLHERFMQDEEKLHNSKRMISKPFGKKAPLLKRNDIDFNIIPGMSIAVHEISGDVLQYYSVGTLSYVNENKLFAFGHNYKLAGEVAKPVSIAYMHTMIEGLERAHKMATPHTIPIGALIYDGFSGILIDKNSEPQTFTVSTNVKVYDNVEKIYNHIVSRNESYTDEFYSQIAMLASIDYEFNYLIKGGQATGAIKVTRENSEKIYNFSVTSDTDIIYRVYNVMYYAYSCYYYGEVCDNSKIMNVEMNIAIH